LAAIVAARGGYGLSRIAPELDLRALVDHPKWLVGFSDITVLHIEAARMGVASMHAHNAAGLGRGDAHARAEWVAALESPHESRSFEGLSVWHDGSASGPLFGGNLTMLFTCAAAGRLAPPPGAIWVIEDVTETAYRLDRMLTALIAAGAFDRASAVVVGELTDCGPGIHGVPALDAVRERVVGLGLPVLAGLPMGHGRDNAPLPLGLPARVQGGRLLLGS
jgi:muramoyltetrapeptide carboxypeptidase